MVDLIGCALAKFAEWIIRQLGKVNDRFEPVDILCGDRRTSLVKVSGRWWSSL